MYPDMVTGLGERLNTVPDLTVLDYEPRSLQVSPAVYFLLSTFERKRAGGETMMEYTIKARLCVKWVDNEVAEQQLAALINPVCAAIDDDPMFGSYIKSGGARITVGNAEYINIGGAGGDPTHRICDISVVVTEKLPKGQGL